MKLQWVIERYLAKDPGQRAHSVRDLPIVLRGLPNARVSHDCGRGVPGGA